MAAFQGKYDARNRHRRSVRLRKYDYSWPGWYYVTACTHGRECTFGDIVGDEIHLSPIGKIVEEEWLRTPKIRPEVELDEHIVMRNHIHGIVIIGERQKSRTTNTVGTHGRASLLMLRRVPGSLSSIMAGFKAAVTTRTNTQRGTPGTPVWQGRFHDHIIRNAVDLHRIREYILNNVLEWALDEENPINQT